MVESVGYDGASERFLLSELIIVIWAVIVPPDSIWLALMSTLSSSPKGETVECKLPDSVEDVKLEVGLIEELGGFGRDGERIRPAPIAMTIKAASEIRAIILPIAALVNP